MTLNGCCAWAQAQKVTLPERNPTPNPYRESGDQMLADAANSTGAVKSASCWDCRAPETLRMWCSSSVNSSSSEKRRRGCSEARVPIRERRGNSKPRTWTKSSRRNRRNAECFRQFASTRGQEGFRRTGSGRRRAARTEQQSPQAERQCYRRTRVDRAARCAASMPIGFGLHVHVEGCEIIFASSNRRWITGVSRSENMR